MAVDGDDHWPVSHKAQAEDTGVGGVDEAKPDPLASPHGKSLRELAIDGGCVADSAAVAGIHHVAEVIDDGDVLVQAPVAQHPGDVAVDLDRLAFLDDERPGQAATDLLVAAHVRVVPEGAGVYGV